nr:ParB/RepB/Spo0J family partition protein [Candidatus Woesebacteria bacterium]
MSTQSIQNISISVLQPNPFQPRDTIKKEDIQELAHSIGKFGILEPLVVAETPAGYQIIAGERRWRAAQIVGLTEVPVIIKKTSPKEMLELAIIENVQRTDLGPMERAQAFQQLQRDFHLNIAEIGERISKSAAYVSNCLRLLTLPDAIKDGLSGGMISEGHARAIAGIENPTEMVNIYKQILKESASVRRAEELARIYKQQHSTSPMVRLRPSTMKTNDPVIQAWETRLKELLKSKSEVKLTRSQR